MKRIKVQDKIQEVIKTFPKGSIFFAKDFLEYGNVASIRKALARLTNKEFLVRLAQGIYLYPKTHEELGTLVPSTEKIAQAIARRDNIRLATPGAVARNRLGLCTQVPTKAVYLTDGSTRLVKIGGRTIKFKHTTSKNLSAKGTISGMVIQALRSIRKKHVDEETLAKIEEVLQKEEKENILHDAKLAPVWISNTLIQAIR